MANTKNPPEPLTIAKLKADPKSSALLERLAGLIREEKEKILKEIDSDLILEELAFFRIAYRNLQDVISDKAREMAKRSHLKKLKKLSRADEFINEAVKLLGDRKGVPKDDEVFGVLMKMGKYENKSIYDPDNRKDSIVSENRVRITLEKARKLHRDATTN